MIERAVNGQSPEQRLAVRREKSRPLVADLEICASNVPCSHQAMIPQRRSTNLLNRWAAFTRFLDDRRVCLSNNAAERALRGVAVGRKIGPSLVQMLAIIVPPPSTP
jgi:transposase